MSHIKILAHVAYDGSDYFGFSISVGKKTIQQTIENTLIRIFNEPLFPLHLEFTSRTDKGVHAFDQLITFFAPDYFDDQKLLLILNQRLPLDIRIQSLITVPDSFFLRDRVKSKVYQYSLSEDRKNPFTSRYSWILSKNPDIDKLNQVLQLMVGCRDFALFAKERYRYSSTVCNISRISCQPIFALSKIEIEIEGDRFLYNMVRRIIGFSVFLTIKKKNIPSTFEELISCYKSQTNMRAPACGLTLKHVFLVVDS
jgi:tRNA pseudouridine38-40 synthase